MAKMLPYLRSDNEIEEMMKDSPGKAGESLLYKLMRDHLPDDWCVIW